MYRLKTIVLFTNSSANAQSPSRQLYSPTFPSSLPSLLPLLTSCISPSLHSSLLHSLPDRVPMSLPRSEKNADVGEHVPMLPRNQHTHPCTAHLFPTHFLRLLFFSSTAACSCDVSGGEQGGEHSFFPLACRLFERCLFVSSSSPTLPILLSSLPLPFLFSCPTPHAFLGCHWSALSPLLFLLEVPLLLEASASAAFGCCMARKHARVLMCLCV